MGLSIVSDQHDCDGGVYGVRLISAHHKHFCQLEDQLDVDVLLDFGGDEVGCGR